MRVIESCGMQLITILVMPVLYHDIGQKSNDPREGGDNSRIVLFWGVYLPNELHVWLAITVPLVTPAPLSWRIGSPPRLYGFLEYVTS